MSNINENELVKTLTKCSLHVRTYLVIFYVPAFNEFGSFADLISSCCADMTLEHGKTPKSYY